MPTNRDGRCSSLIARVDGAVIDSYYISSSYPVPQEVSTRRARQQREPGNPGLWNMTAKCSALTLGDGCCRYADGVWRPGARWAKFLRDRRRVARTRGNAFYEPLLVETGNEIRRPDCFVYLPVCLHDDQVDAIIVENVARNVIQTRRLGSAGADDDLGPNLNSRVTRLRCITLSSTSLPASRGGACADDTGSITSCHFAIEKARTGMQCIEAQPRCTAPSLYGKCSICA